MSKSKFIGESGEHYAAYKLARKEYYVGVTLGNMPDVDLLLSSKGGLKTISLQVKSRSGAHRRNRYGHEGFEWNVNTSVIGRESLNFWYFFVDFKWDNEAEPDVYIVPSKWVAEFVRPNFTRKLFFLPKPAAELTRNNWGIFDKIFDEDVDTLNWASQWDEENFVRWGGPEIESINS